MRCLYCGKQLAFFRKLTGGGEFCSDAHRRSYQDEYNRLALSRLLQSQTPGEEPAPPAKLPPASKKLKMRAGSMLGLEDMEALPAQALARQVELTRDAKKQAGFVYVKPDLCPGRVLARADIGPVSAGLQLDLGDFPLQAAAPAMPSGTGRCVLLAVSGIIAPPASEPRRRFVHFANGMQPVLLDWHPEPDSPLVLVNAPRTSLTVNGKVAGVVGPRPLPCKPLRMEPLFILPLTAPALSKKAPVEGRPASLRLISVRLAGALLWCEDVAGFSLRFGFADTLATGFVAGMRLGIEQIRFELGEGANASQVHFEEPAPEPVTAAPEQPMLPRQFIQAVQGSAIPSTEPEAIPEPAAEPQAQVRSAGIGAAERMCGWLPIALTPTSVGTRQRLMQTCQAIGIASTAPVQPSFEMLPLRPKFGLPQEAEPSTQEEENVPVPPAPEAVETVDAAQPDEAVAPVESQAAEAPCEEESVETPVSAEESIYTSTLDFLEHYEQKKSGFSKLLGRMGIGCLLIGALSAAGQMRHFI